MKLFTRYNRINVIASILVFLIGCVAFYFAIRYILVRQLDKTLQSERIEILQYVKEHNILPEIVNTNEQQISFTLLQAPFNNPIFYTDKIWIDNENEWVRIIAFTVVVDNKNYKATVTKSQMETEELLKLIIAIAMVMIALIIAANFVINRLALKKLWQPFYATISRISQYQLSNQQVLQLPTTPIDEFNLLNNSFNSMTKKIEHEYETLKEFTGNAAHEMQTPLAVITSSTDALMQDEILLQNHHQTIAVIEQSVNKLSRLNQSLLLLTKIENQRFELNELVRWDVFIKQKINELNELVTSQQLQLLIKVEPVTNRFHHHLADIIIGNLLNNAIRYNVEKGSIDITLNNSQLSVTNTSKLPALDAEKVGSRFYRHSATMPNGNGLGLSIVNQICTVAGYRFVYKYVDCRHQFTIFFKQ